MKTSAAPLRDAETSPYAMQAGVLRVRTHDRVLRRHELTGGLVHQASRSLERPNRLGRFGALLLALSACGSAPPSTQRSAELPAHPCVLHVSEGVLQVPVPRGHALAAGDGACLLIDERSENTFVSIGRLGEDSAGFEQLPSDARTYLRESGVLGADVRFTGRGAGRFANREASIERFVATPPGLPERAGVAAFVPVDRAVLVVLSLADDAEQAERLMQTVASSHFAP